jgi:ubiquinone/menaquinone biosynthesis C-methylase UbiE
MKQGDFTALAKAYQNRPGYSDAVIRCLGRYVGAFESGAVVAEVGAGTGKLTEILARHGLRGYAVEPNDAMRAEGTHALADAGTFEWRAGSGEETGLPSGCARWAVMASSFHWTDHERSLPEFHRVLQPGGFFTCMWNPRDLESSELHMRIERRIYEVAPQITRVSSGGKQYTLGLEQKLVSTGHFRDVVFVEAAHEVAMTKERYMGAWRSVNDIQAQAGPEGFARILAAIEAEIADLDEVVVPYRTRSWTVQRVD